jgi:hypothetical protein
LVEKDTYMDDDDSDSILTEITEVFFFMMMEPKTKSMWIRRS